MQFDDERGIKQHEKVRLINFGNLKVNRWLAVSPAMDQISRPGPESYDRIAFKEKCDNVFDFVVEFAASGRKWVA